MTDVVRLLDAEKRQLKVGDRVRRVSRKADARIGGEVKELTDTQVGVLFDRALGMVFVDPSTLIIMARSRHDD